ncbi:alpha-amylase family glycosyl hydrolase [Oceanobacillus sp. CAU 1775]
MKRNVISVGIAILAFFIYTMPIFAESNQIKDEMLYEIIVDRFNNGNYEIDDNMEIDNPKAYQGGDIEGVRLKLDELSTLGVSTLTLSPIMKNAEQGFHGYWIEDFTEINPNFGSMEELNTLIEEAHKRDIKIVLEFVTNYVAKSHPIVTDATKADWVLTDQVDGADWTEEVVQLDQDNPEVQAFLLEAATYWLEETEIDGFTLHAVDQSSLDFLEMFTETLKAEHDIYLLGDIFVDSDNMAEILERTSLDAIDNNALGQLIAETFSEPDQPVSNIFDASVQAMEYPSLVGVDNKYSKRFSQKFAENGRNALTTWTLALTYMYTTPGTPLILQGSEVSMYGEDAEGSQRLVPFMSGDPDIKEFFDRISSLRSEFPALRQGDFELVEDSVSMLVFKRTLDDETLYVAINNGSESNYTDITDIPTDKMLRGYLGDNIVRANEENNHRIGIPRESVEVFEVVDEEGFNWTIILMVAGIMFIFVAGVIYLSIKQKRDEAKDNQ